ncbi:hypothetical protein [Dactylosporangium sp. CA-139066]|uniref:hypothetical protein n=1 Tax=Dactylosporangium sp. CA-139066 TaxID=3239930 RepID=UPI003D8C31C3
MAVLVGMLFLLGWVTGGHSFPDADDASPGWLEPLVTMVAYGVAGALLIDRRPDLPSGWMLAGAAVLVVVEMLVLPPSYEAVVHGDHGAAPRWGLTVSAFGFAPIAAQGLINIRFPSGRPASRWGSLLEKVLITSTALVILGGILRRSARSRTRSPPCCGCPTWPSRAPAAGRSPPTASRPARRCAGP